MAPNKGGSSNYEFVSLRRLLGTYLRLSDFGFRHRSSSESVGKQYGGDDGIIAVMRMGVGARGIRAVRGRI